MAQLGPRHRPGQGGRTKDDIASPAEPGAAKAVGRRALLARGGIVAAGVAGAGVVGAAVAGPASAAAGDPILQDTINLAGTSDTPTELDAANNTTPAFILANTGIDTSNGGAGPALRLTPSTATEPTAATVGGDLTATSDGTLWFTHGFSGGPFAAPVLTEATGNVYVPLSAPDRVVDTRAAASRANIVNASGNLDSSGRLLAGKTIFINLDGLVYFAEAVFANLTVTGSSQSGHLNVWSGATPVPSSSTINFSAKETIANFVSCGVAEYSTSITNVIAIHASATTHLILDVTAFSLPGFEYAKFSSATTGGSRAARLQRAQRAMRADGISR